MHVEHIVFLSLVLDLFAFTIPLPLFPRIIEWYTLREGSNPNGFLSLTLRTVSAVRETFYKPAGNPQKWDIVLLGGLMGSVFSALQWFISPHIGSLSDKYGRKRILLYTMIGNILSAVVWMQSTSFASYLLSRVIGGLSEGNVQLAIAILSDVTTPANRSKALAHVGIAFAICFCIGPPIGAYFASHPLSSTFGGYELNIYATPAFISLILLTLETVFLIVALPETRGKGKQIQQEAEKEEEKKTNGTLNGHMDPREDKPKKLSVEERLVLLGDLKWTHLCFLAVFSGVEFTLTFLTFDLFDWDNRQNGALIGTIGVVSAVLQGGYVRRAMSKIGEGKMARRGVYSCILALICLSILPRFVSTRTSLAVNLLRAACVCLAFTSATVVNSLTAYASLQCDDAGVDPDTGKVIEEHPELTKGKALGSFRSFGQFGRAVGPLIACGLYWTFGPSATYATCAVAMYVVSWGMIRIASIKPVAA
ncbi:MFS general substrate transporter [Panus rudis PR-1116 ss-1]|nr:MFS general substrate transporter [Panus rudis PR-1116 ss-1]